MLAWIDNPWGWTLVCLPFLVLRIWLQRKLGKINGRRRSVILSLLAWASWCGAFGLLHFLSHSINIVLRIGIPVGFIVISGVFDALSCRPASTASKGTEDQPTTAPQGDWN